MVSFKEKYISSADKEKDKDSKKIVISNGAYAVGEQLDIIAFRLRGIKNG